MENSCSKNTIKNIALSGFNKIINILLPFIVRSVLISVLGVQYLGLNSLFISILQVINLAELGVSSAIVFSMYKPIAENDENTICALMNLYKNLYKVIGSLIFLLGILIIPFLKFFIKGSYPTDINIYLLYIVYLLNTVMGYFFFAYKGALLNAHQKSGVISNINSIFIIVQNIIQIILLLIFRNYYAYIIVMPIFTVLNNVKVAILVNKMYPMYKPRGKLNKEVTKNINKKVKGLLISKICNTTKTTFDSIFISSFVGLTAVAIYSNYYYVMASILSFLVIITNAMIASVGNSLILETVEKNYSDMMKFNFIYSWISGICTVCLLCLYQPFMKLWVGEEMTYPIHIVIAFCMYFYAINLGGIRAIYHDAAGLWWEARYRAILESILNLVLNIILTARFGVFGTIVGTLISLIIVNYGYGTQIVFKYYFKGFKVKYFYFEHIKYTLVTTINCIITYFIINKINDTGILDLIIKLVICLIIPNIINYMIYRKNKYFIKSLEMFRRILISSMPS